MKLIDEIRIELADVFFVFCFIFAFIFISGCATHSLDKPYIFTIPETTVIVMPENEYPCKPPIAGRTFCKQKRIYVEGYYNKDHKVIIKDRKALGHEITNIIYYYDEDNKMFNHEKLCD